MKTNKKGRRIQLPIIWSRPYKIFINYLFFPKLELNNLCFSTKIYKLFISPFTNKKYLFIDF